jgi:hypothetical protein
MKETFLNSRTSMMMRERVRWSQLLRALTQGVQRGPYKLQRLCIGKSILLPRDAYQNTTTAKWVAS